MINSDVEYQSLVATHEVKSTNDYGTSFHCNPNVDEERRCDCNHQKDSCHCSDSDCDWDPYPVFCRCDKKKNS